MFNLLKFAGIVACICGALVPVTVPASLENGRWVEGQILAQPRHGLKQEHFDNLLRPQHAASRAVIPGIGVHIISVPSGAEDAVVNALKHNPNIEFAEKDFYLKPVEYTPNDPKFSSAWHLQTMNLPAAWDINRGAGITVAVLDTGVNPSHEDLSGKLVPGRNVVSGNSNTADIYGHGTKVAGVIGAIMNNGLGVASIAPDSRIMPIRITNSPDGWASISAMANGITWAADHGARVANISYEATSSSSVRTAADYMRNKGGLVVVSAGNSGTDLGIADSRSIITVSAVNSSDNKPSWSNYGNYIDVAAPGTGIWTTNNNGDYSSVSGTSFASPVTAATIALIMGVDGSLTADEAEAVLENSAIDIGSNGWDQEFGHGRVDALAAVLLAGGESSVDVQPPMVTITSPQDNDFVGGVINVNVTAADNVGVSRVELFDVNGHFSTDYSAPYGFSWDASSLVEGGQAVLTAVAHDGSGNSRSTSVTVYISDTTPPDISAPADKTVEATAALTGVSLGSATAIDNVDGPVAVTASNTGPFAVGSHQVTWSAIDSSGNRATAAQAITVRDTTAPVVTAPADVSVAATGSLTNVYLGLASAVDLVDGNIAVAPSTVGPFSVGSHVVTWRAIDDAGNSGFDTQVVAVTQPDTTAPEITVPPDVVVEATGPLTPVDFGVATAVDDSDGPVAVVVGDEGPFPVGVTQLIWSASDSEGNSVSAVQQITVRDTTPPQIVVPSNIHTGASGVLSHIDLGVASAHDLVSGDLEVIPDNDGPYASGRHYVTWTTRDLAGNEASATQVVTVLPQADFAIDQTVSEGAEVLVTVLLSGEAPEYPVNIPYTVGGSAINPLDHNAVSGEIVIDSGTSGSFIFQTVDDGVGGEPANSVEFEMLLPGNAVRGLHAIHTVTIVEENVPPLVNLEIEQSGSPVRTTYTSGGLVEVAAEVKDSNPTDSHVFDWSLTDNRLVAENSPDESKFILDPRYLEAGIYTLRVTVTDSGIPAESITAEIAISVQTDMPLLSDTEDQDGDGLIDAQEGAGDVDQDGVPDYLDGIHNPSVLQAIRAESGHHLLVTEPGVQLRIGTTALATDQGSALVGLGDIGISEGNTAEGLVFPGGLFDFVLTGLTEVGQSVRIVLPQLVSLADGSVYRKYVPGSGWQDFVVDSRNGIASAPGENGACPAPGDPVFRPGLHEGDNCIQLTLEDGGPNDADRLRNGVIRDPGGAGSAPQSSSDTGNSYSSVAYDGSGGGGGCTVRSAGPIDPVWFLILILAFSCARGNKQGVCRRG